MKLRFDVVIVGAGMVGAALACALGDTRLKVALLDGRAPTPPEDGSDYDLRVSAITLASQALFRNLGTWETMRRRRVAPVEAMRIWEDGSEIRFDAADIGEAALAYIVENRVIQQSLIERLHAFTNVQTLWPVTFNTLTFDADSATLTLQDGRQLQTRLLVGADGADSAVRRAAQIESRRLDLRQHSVVATVRTEMPHGNIARQRFLPTGPLAFLPLPEPNTSSIVWSANAERADALMALDDAAFLAELQVGFGDALGKIVSVSARRAFPLALSHANRYTAPRLALVGDAAHTVHPLAGQGVNLGLLDAATLADTVLDATARGRDIGAHHWLRRYERKRRGDNLGMIATTGGFRYLFSNEWPLVRNARRVGLGFTDRLAPVKRFIMRRAAGLSGELPALARARHSME